MCQTEIRKSLGAMVEKPIHNLIIGIDPDTKASGWACIDLQERKIHLETQPLLSILDLLDEWRVEVDEGYLDIEYTYRFVLEDIWSTAHNWHTSPRDNHRVVAKKGYHLGKCSMVGETLRDAITRKGFPLICQPPLAKIWKGTDRKITHEEFVEVCKRHRLTLDKRHLNRTNQEERDAGLLAIHHLNTPIRIYSKIV